MRRSLAAAAILAAVVGYPGSAEASIWDWIQELSGPGPSDGRGNIAFTHCYGNGPLKLRPRVSDAPVTSTSSLNTSPCVYFDYRRFKNEDHDNFPAEVKLSFYDVGPTWELLREGQIEVGVGVGVMRSEGNNISHSHFTVTFFRFAIQPLSLVPGWERKRGAAILKWYVRATLIPGTIDATDFGVGLGSGAGQSTFSAKNDTVRSMGFMVDLLEVLRP